MFRTLPLGEISLPDGVEYQDILHMLMGKLFPSSLALPAYECIAVRKGGNGGCVMVVHISDIEAFKRAWREAEVENREEVVTAYKQLKRDIDKVRP